MTLHPTDNPAPTAPVLSYARPLGQEPGVWRSGKFVIVSDDADLPLRCVVCGRLASEFVAREVRRARGPLRVGLCDVHADARKIRHAAVTAIMIFAVNILLIAFGLYAFENQPVDGWSFFYVVAGFAAGSILVLLPGTIMSRIFRPLGRAKRVGAALWLRPSSQTFRNSLCEWESAATSTPVENP